MQTQLENAFLLRLSSWGAGPLGSRTGLLLLQAWSWARRGRLASRRPMPLTPEHIKQLHWWPWRPRSMVSPARMRTKLADSGRAGGRALAGPVWRWRSREEVRALLHAVQGPRRPSGNRSVARWRTGLAAGVIEQKKRFGPLAPPSGEGLEWLYW